MGAQYRMKKYRQYHYMRDWNIMLSNLVSVGTDSRYGRQGSPLYSRYEWYRKYFDMPPARVTFRVLFL